MAVGRILVLGASGYIGSRLVTALVEGGHQVRASVRSRSKLPRCSWASLPGIEIAEADVLDKEALARACKDCDVIYYLIHSMNPYSRDFVEADRRAAQNTVECAGRAGVKRIIYLGGLGEDERTLSKHLRSRMEVLKILHAGPVSATSFRAAMIIGRGSLSFEILRCLVRRMPVIVAPSWISTESQPIAVDNVIYYLTACLDKPSTLGQIFDIGGPDIVSYRQLMEIFQKEAGLRKRLIIAVPAPLISALSFIWMGTLATYPKYLVKPLFEGLKNRVICRDNRINGIIAQKLLDCQQAIKAALT